MKKIFEIPEMEVVRFVDADIVVCSGCDQEWECNCYSSGSITCTGGNVYETDNPLDDCDNRYSSLGCKSDTYVLYSAS